MYEELVRNLIDQLGHRYSRELGIDVDSGKDDEISKWMIASVLFGARISEGIAKKTYQWLAVEGLVTPDAIIEKGLDDIVYALDTGGYVRYDFKTADKLLELSKNLKEGYDSSLNNLYRISSASEDLVMRIKGLAKGIGDVTVSIFLREMLNVWDVEPMPSELVRLAGTKLRIDLKKFWKDNRSQYIALETALLRLAKDFCRKKKCDRCSFTDRCAEPVLSTK
ncbi:MAG: hypothetical protein ACE5QW_06790 [Thermoplasmata archaeon]